MWDGVLRPPPGEALANQKLKDLENAGALIKKPTGIGGATPMPGIARSSTPAVGGVTPWAPAKIEAPNSIDYGAIVGAGQQSSLSLIHI